MCGTILKMEKNNKKKLFIDKIKEIPSEQEKPYIIIPNTAQTSYLTKTFNNYNDLALWTYRATEINHNDIIFSYTEKHHIVKIEKDNISLTIKYPNVNNFIGKNDNISKVFVFLLAKINEQAIGKNEDGEITIINEYITFNIEELINLGIYTGKTKNGALTNAKKGLYTCYEKLARLEITMSGNMRVDKKSKKESLQSHSFLFSKFFRKGSQVRITLQKDGFFSYLSYDFFTIIPKWAFKLDNKAFALLKLIFERARFETKNITDKNIKSGSFSFNISMRNIQNTLSIPNEEQTNKHNEYIRKPIEKAIEDIEKAYGNEINIDESGNYEKNIDLEILVKPKRNEQADYKETIQEFLEQYIEITLKGQFADFFIKQFINSRKKNQKTEKPKDKLTYKQ